VASRHLLTLRRAVLPQAGERKVAGHRRRTPYYGWVLMVVLGITTIISYGTTQYLFGVLVVPLDATFHWGRASISGAYTLGLIIAGFQNHDICHAYNMRNFTSQRAFIAAILSLSPATRLFRVVKRQEVEVYRMWWVLHPDQWRKDELMVESMALRRAWRNSSPVVWKEHPYD
jgi:hypothetical protein